MSASQSQAAVSCDSQLSVSSLPSKPVSSVVGNSGNPVEAQAVPVGVDMWEAPTTCLNCSICLNPKAEEYKPVVVIGSTQVISHSKEGVSNVTTDEKGVVQSQNAAVGEAAAGKQNVAEVKQIGPSNVTHAGPSVQAVDTGKSVGLFVKGVLEGKEVEFLVDTGANATLISLALLETLLKSIRTTFQDRLSTLTLADGKKMLAREPVLSNIKMGNLSILEAIYAAPIAERALMGLSTIEALNFQLTVAGVEVKPCAPSVRHISSPYV